MRQVLVSDTDSLHVSSDDSCKPEQDVLTEGEGTVLPIHEDVMVHSVEGSVQI